MAFFSTLTPGPESENSHFVAPKCLQSLVAAAKAIQMTRADCLFLGFSTPEAV